MNTAANTDVILTQGLSKTFKGVKALDSLNLIVPKNSIFGFPGPNGAGKSTTIKLLSVKQQRTNRPAMRQGRCDWVLFLGKGYPTDLNIKQGADRSALHLGGLSLTHLQVDSGVGELLLDLSSNWQRSLEIFVKTGVGDNTLRFPDEAGIRLQIQVGLGSTKPNKLTWDGEAYVNPVFGKSPVTLNIIVDSGIGKVNLE